MTEIKELMTELKELKEQSSTIYTWWQDNGMLLHYQSKNNNAVSKITLFEIFLCTLSSLQFLTVYFHCRLSFIAIHLKFIMSIYVSSNTNLCIFKTFYLY